MSINTTISFLHVLGALVLGAFVGGIAGYIGSLMVSKRMALVGGALGHLALPGVSLALLYGFDVSVGAIIFLGFGVLLIWFIAQKTGLAFEVVTAIVFAVSLSVSFLVVPKEEIDIALLGNISDISLLAVLISCVSALIIFFVIRYLFSEIVLTSISSDLAHVQGVAIRRNNLLYLVAIALVVALGVRIVGGLMTAALVSIPAATARNMSRSLFQYAYLSLLFGSLSCCLGVVSSIVFGLAVGPMIIIASGLLFVVSLFYLRKR